MPEINSRRPPVSSLRTTEGMHQAGPPTAPKSSGLTASAIGPLAGHTVMVGDGAQGQIHLATYDKVKPSGLMSRVLQNKFAGTIAMVLAAPLVLVAGAGLMVARGFYALFSGTSTLKSNLQQSEAAAETRFVAANSRMIKTLGQTAPGSVSQDKTVMDKLHACGAGRLSNEEIDAFVVAGENLHRVLQNSEPPHDTLHINEQGAPVAAGSEGSIKVKSSLYTTRALSWYMMALAAKQDGINKSYGLPTNSLVADASYRIPDPGNRLYTFMSNAPSAAARMSSHYEERVDHAQGHRVLDMMWMGKNAHKGIEDFGNKLPGKGGALVFNRLKSASEGAPAEIYLKFEEVGCPAYMSHESHHTLGDKALRFFAAFDRNALHTAHFLQTRGGVAASAELPRQEHAYKGPLKDEVGDHYVNLLHEVARRGLVNQSEAKHHANAMKSRGLVGVNEGIEFLKQKVEHIRPRLRTMKVLSDSASPEAQAQARKDLGDAISKLEDRLERMSLDIKEVGWKMGDHLQLDGGPAESRRGLEVYIAPPDGRI